MTESILSIIALVLPLLVEWWQGRKHEAQTYEHDAAEFDKALADGNADDLSLMFDELRVPPGAGDRGGQNDP